MAEPACYDRVHRDGGGGGGFHGGGGAFHGGGLRIVELLNAFFDLVVPGVIASGGDILKYVGDAVIEMFPVTGGDPTPA